MNEIIRFFDLYSQYRSDGSRAQAGDGSAINNWLQVAVYFACLVGIFAGPYVIDAASGRYPSAGQLFRSWDHVLWSMLFAIILTATLFKTWLTPNSPWIVQLGTAIVVGIGSGKFIPIAVKALTPT